MDNLIRLVYTSKATFKPVENNTGIEPHVARILMVSRRNNPKSKVGGVLYYGNGYFFQCLEGPTRDVNTISQRISMDPRHAEFIILRVENITERMFKNWSMKYVPVESEIKSLLMSRGYQDFTPHLFDGETIDQLIELFAQKEPAGSQPDQNYSHISEEPSSGWNRFKSFFANASNSSH